MEANFITVVAARSKKKPEDVKALWLDGKDHWLNADEMVRFGFVGKKITATAKSLKELDKQTVEAMTMETIYDRYAAVLDKKSIINKNSNLEKMNVALLIAAFALTGVTAESPEADILTALKKKFETLETKVSNMEAEAKAKVTTAIKAELDAAQTAGKFVPGVGQTVEGVRATYQTIGETAGIDALKTVLAGMGAKTPIASMIRTGSQSTPAAGVQNWDWYQKNDPSALEAMATDNPDQFRELFKAEYGTYPA